ncbi:hypothetical protein Tco_1015180 [Tanacetum coccineum]|uniref:Uncharacterized protein n=1 Tax=Tanacetum coccineum TaxID=301880 RepID=A0ABQ5FK55_9ASTR
MYCLRYDVEASEKLWFIRVPSKTSNKENKDTVPEKEIITDDIYNWITEKYGAPNETWNGDQIALVADDVVKTFFDKSDSKQDVPECSMIEANVPECSTKTATKDVARPIAATNIVDPQTEVIEISSGIEELESSSTSELESSSTGDDSDDEEFSSSSEDDTEEEAEDDTDEEAEDDTEDDTDDETWSPKTIGTTSKKGATSSSSPSTKKTIVNRGEPVRHCILGLPNPKTCEMIRKKEFRVTKEDVKKQVNDSNEQVNKVKCLLEERRERAAICEAKDKMKMTKYYNDR